MKKNILTSVLLASAIAFTANAADLEKINVLNNWVIDVTTTSDLVLAEWAVNWDLKVLKEYVVSFAKKDQIDLRKVSLNLLYPLETNKSYTLLGIEGADANMVFTIGETLSWEILNDKKWTWVFIEKINILDSKTLEIYYSETLEKEEFVYRILSEVEVSEKISTWKNNFSIALKTPLESLSPYIILSENLINEKGEKVSLEEKYYDFETKSDLENVFEDLEVISSGEVVDENNTWNLEEFATSVKRTPETGSPIFYILLMTLILAWFLVFLRKNA